VRLIEALEKLKEPSAADVGVFQTALACGFTPLHFATFLRAHLAARLAGKRVQLDTGLFGDLSGNVERLNKRPLEAAVVVVEWEDLDSRLGVRALGGWQANNLPDIVNSATHALAILKSRILNLSGAVPVYVSAPTLPLPPLFATSPEQSDIQELRLRGLIASFCSAISEMAGVRVVGSQQLDQLSPPKDRFDFKSAVHTGFPYTLSHASCLAEMLARLIAPDSSKKGLITDLDDTLWAGILGEVGPAGVSWSLSDGTHLHGIYQQLLASLASAGVLLAIASKNEMRLVDQVFEREDLRLSKDNIYPFEVHWSRKSESVRRILKLWNVAPDAVVFLDDSPMEVAEVKDAFTEMECIVFPKNDPVAFWSMLQHLRQTFAKAAISEEDLIRVRSIREAPDLGNIEVNSTSFDKFLKDASASIQVEFHKYGRHNRAFELLNKSNQFNLNGKRLTEAGWSAYFQSPSAFLMTVTYQDKYGPLGLIGVVLGRAGKTTVDVDYWAMSCRAFSRRIEHQTLRQVFAKFEAEEIRFDYEPTARNVPLREFLVELLGGPPQPGSSLLSSDFSRRSFGLFQCVEETINE